MSVQELSGRVVLITGGGSGIGQGIATALAEAGAAVWLVGRRAEPLESVASAIRERGGQAGYSCADVTDGAAGARAIKECVAAYGGLHALVNNAGRGLFTSFKEAGDDRIADTLNVNLLAPTLLSKHAQAELARHKGSGGGVILNIASSVAHMPLQRGAVYAAAKAGLVHLTRCLAFELAPHGIRVNCISPGAVDTGALAADAPVPPSALAARTPLGRLGSPADIAAAARFLCSPAASWITGSVLTVDGGLSLT
jgi:NAD(P)-dependent dehydrogenase (short-subunit alcohol dehydrogenase family)